MDEVAPRPVLAIDLGGTQIRAAHISPDRSISCRRAVPTRDEAGPEAVVDRICRLAEEVLDAARDAGLPPPVGIGISAPGPLDQRAGVVLAPPNLAGWHDVPLVRLVEERLGLPTFLERDTNVAVMAEWRHGAASDASDVVYVTVSTGIGGGLVVDGRPLYGRDGSAGEIGHLTVDLDGPADGDGGAGHVEAIASGTGIERAARQLLDRGRAAGLAALLNGSDEVTAELVAKAADEGDADCRAVMDRAVEALGATLAGLVNVLNPEVIVIGGGIAEHRPQLLEAARAEIDRRAFPIPARRVRLERPRFGGDVSLIGALPIVNERMHEAAAGGHRS